VGSSVAASDPAYNNMDNAFLKLAVYDSEGTNVQLRSLPGRMIPRRSNVIMVPTPSYFWVGKGMAKVMTFTDLVELHSLGQAGDGASRDAGESEDHYTQRPPNFAKRRLPPGGPVSPAKRVCAPAPAPAAAAAGFQGFEPQAAAALGALDQVAVNEAE
jgi:hypothetical protein